MLVAKAGALIDLGRQVLPSLDDRLSQIAEFLGSADEAWAIQRAYALAPKANFSHAILEDVHPSARGVTACRRTLERLGGRRSASWRPFGRRGSRRAGSAGWRGSARARYGVSAGKSSMTSTPADRRETTRCLTGNGRTANGGLGRGRLRARVKDGTTSWGGQPRRKPMPRYEFNAPDVQAAVRDCS